MLCYAYEQKSPMTPADMRDPNPQSIEQKMHNMDDSPPMNNMPPAVDYGARPHVPGFPHHPHYQVSTFGISMPTNIPQIVPGENREGETYGYGATPMNHNSDSVTESDVTRTSATDVWGHNPTYAYTGIHGTIPQDPSRLFANERDWNSRSSDHMSYEASKHFYPYPPSTCAPVYPSAQIPIPNGHHPTSPTELGHGEILFPNGQIPNGENVAKYGIDPANPTAQRHPYDWINKNSYIASQPPATGKTRTKDKYRVVYSDHQRLELEKEFRFSRYITIRRKSELAMQLSLSERQIKIWFQNRRAKERKISKKRGGESSSDAYPDSVKQHGSTSEDEEKIGMQNDINNNGIKCENEEPRFAPAFEYHNGESRSPTEYDSTNSIGDGLPDMRSFADYRQQHPHSQFVYKNPPVSHQQLCGVMPMPAAVPVTPTESNSDATEKFTYGSQDKSPNVCNLP